MAQLKDSIVSGNLRITDTLLSDAVQVTTLRAPSTAGGTTYGVGTNGQVLKSNGTSSYWGTVDTVGTSTVGGTYLPIYLNAGTPTAITVKNNTQKSAIGWSSGAAANAALVTLNSIAYWNGCYSGTSSNLEYCAKGAFGTIITKATTDYSKVSISRNLTSGTKIGTITIDGTGTDLYCETNADEKVKQSASASSNFRPVVLGYTNTSTVSDLDSTVTDQVYVTKKLYFQPSTGDLYSAGDLILTTTGSGIKMTDGSGVEYPAIWDNTHNLWIGASMTASTHHIGKTYISAGYDDTNSIGNGTIYVSIPNATNTDATNYPILHTGNTSVSTSTVSGATSVKSIKINGTDYNIYDSGNTDTKATQNILADSVTATYPLALSYYETGSTTTTAQTLNRVQSIYAQPSTGTVFASTFDASSLVLTQGSYKGTITQDTITADRTWKFPKHTSGIIHIEQRANFYDDTTGADTTPWHKVASLTTGAASTDRTATFIVAANYSGDVDKRFGILQCHLRTNGSKVFSSAELTWLYKSPRMFFSDIVLGYKSVANTSTTIEIWAKSIRRYSGYTFTLLDEHDRKGVISGQWDLTVDNGSTGVAAIPSDLTQINSTYLNSGDTLNSQNITSSTGATIEITNTDFDWNSYSTIMLSFALSGNSYTNVIIPWKWFNAGGFSSSGYIPYGLERLVSSASLLSITGGQGFKISKGSGSWPSGTTKLVVIGLP